MDSAKSWLQKLQPRDKSRGSTRKKDSFVYESGSDLVSDDDGPSNVTKQRVEVAKQYIENHYKEQMKNLHERKERRSVLEKKLVDVDVSEEDHSNLLNFLEKKEAEYMRLQRHKMGVEDFEMIKAAEEKAGDLPFAKENETLDSQVPREYVEVPNTSTLVQLALKPLSKDKLDKVRDEWVAFVQRFL